MTERTPQSIEVITSKVHFHLMEQWTFQPKQEGNVLQNLRQQWFKETFMNVSIAPMLLLILLSQKLSESPRIPKLSSATLVALFQPINRYYYGHFPKIIIRHPGGTQWPNWSIWSDWCYMVIFPKLSWNTLVPLFQPKSILVNLVRLAKSRYYMVIFPKLSSDTLGVPSDLRHPTNQLS